MRERLSTKAKRPVSWCSFSYNVANLRPEIKKRFPSNLKIHYSEVVGVAEKITKRLKLKNQRSYDVQKYHRRSLGVDLKVCIDMQTTATCNRVHYTHR